MSCAIVNYIWWRHTLQGKAVNLAWKVCIIKGNLWVEVNGTLFFADKFRLFCWQMAKVQVTKERVILGIDPGTSIMGYGVLCVVKGSPKMVNMGLVKMKHLTDPYLKLKRIFSETMRLIEHYSPDELAIEAPFYGKNVQSMLKLGRAQGAAIAAALQRDIPIFEYAPRKIKVAITGQGAASKEQVAAILQKILRYTEIPEDYDASDALAVALCHFYQKNISTGSNYKGWADFVKKNPGKSQ